MIKSKKLYNPPQIRFVKLDRELVLLVASEGAPPDLGGGGGKDKLPIPNPVSGNNFEDKNNFNENPFAK